MKERGILFAGSMVRAIGDGTKTQTRRLVNLETLRVRLPRAVVSDFPEIMPDAHARAGTYRARLNPIGAVTLDLRDGFGVKPGEFHFTCPYADGDTHLANYGTLKCWTIVPSTHQRLWVRETWQAWKCTSHESDEWEAITRDVRAGASWAEWVEQRGKPDAIAYRADGTSAGPWTPAIHMPRWASRHTLGVAHVRMQRLHDITEDDAKAEGVESFFTRFPACGRDQCIISGERAGDAPYRASFAVLWDEINGDRAPWTTNPFVWAVTFGRVT